MKTANEKSYLSILKATIIFGSTQVFQMVIMLLRSKVSAILLGAFGMGLTSIFQSSILTISQFASCGIFQSGIRDISKYHGLQDDVNLGESVRIFSNITNILAVAGVAILLLLSYPLSFLLFSNDNYTTSFLMLSVAVFFYILSQKQITIMQATRQTKTIAYSSLATAVSSLIICYLFYKYFGIKGVVPAIIFSFAFQFLIVSVGIKKVAYKNKPLILKELFKNGRPMLSLGLVLMLSVLLINIFTLSLNGFINRFGKIEDVGYFYAAFAITNGNILILISVLSSDYFPKLSACIEDSDEANVLVNQQAELMTLVAAPITIGLIVFASFIVNVLLSKEFFVIIPMLKLMSLGLLFRIVWQSMSYVILASGDKKTYFLYDAVFGNGIVFLCNVLFYVFFGLEGLGYSFVVSSIMVAFLLSSIVRKRKKIILNSNFLKSFSVSIVLCMLAFFLSFRDDLLLFSVIILIISCFYSVSLILKRINVNLRSFLRVKGNKSC